MLHHLALGTRDVARLSAFYRDVLGLRELARHAHADGSLRSVWLDLGGAALMIEQSSEPARFVDGVGSGLFLLALTTTQEERPDFERRLAAGGAVIESRSELTSYARDPDGNRFAISAYPLPR